MGGCHDALSHYWAKRLHLGTAAGGAGGAVDYAMDSFRDEVISAEEVLIRQRNQCGVEKMAENCGRD